MDCKSLVLVGGYSTRMGRPKYSLSVTSGPGQEYSLLVHILQCHADFQIHMLGNHVPQVTISIRDQAQKLHVDALVNSFARHRSMRIDYVFDDTANAGPISGLLAAYESDRSAHWITTGCDYPLLQVASLAQLWLSHQSQNPAVTSFLNQENYSEPLLAVWSPRALTTMRQMAVDAYAQSRNLGPNRVIRTLQQLAHDRSSNKANENRVDLLVPQDYQWLKNVNTPHDWEVAQKIMNSTKEN